MLWNAYRIRFIIPAFWFIKYVSGLYIHHTFSFNLSYIWNLERNEPFLQAFRRRNGFYNCLSLPNFIRKWSNAQYFITAIFFNFHANDVEWHECRYVKCPRMWLISISRKVIEKLWSFYQIWNRFHVIPGC